MTVFSLPLYYQQEQVWFLPTKEPELVQIWDDYKASWPWGSLVCLHYLSLRCPCWFSPDQRSPGDSPTDKFCGCPPLCLWMFSLCLSVGTRTNKKDIVRRGMGLFWPCVWLPPFSALLSFLMPANICSDCFPKSWSDENVFISLLLPQLCLQLFLFCSTVIIRVDNIPNVLHSLYY